MIRSTTPTNPRSSRLPAALLGMALAASTALGAAGPRDVVQRLGDQVLAVLKDKSLSNDAKRQRIMEIAQQGVDFDTLARLVLARNWSRFTPQEQAQFREEFRKHLSVTYGKSVDSYKNEELSIVGDHEEARGDWTVKTKILRGGPDDILVDYRLRQSNGEWMIIDFIVEGVSLVANFRSQFQDLLASDTPKQLIELLHEKNAKGESIVKDNKT
jgi:phospholipid transport system substrate-binding protein